MRKKIITSLQRLGKALMTPISVLPIAGLMLTLGIFLKIDILKTTGEVVFNNLPVIFAIGVATSFSKDSFAALSAFLMFLAFNVSISQSLGIDAETVVESANYTFSLGIPTLQSGIFGGLLVGFITALIFKYFSHIVLPDYLTFFSGSRLAILLSLVVSVPLGVTFPYIWVPIQNAIQNFSQIIVQTNVPLASFVYGIIERMLVPLGLQHIWNVPFYYHFGEYLNLSGEIITGDIPIFFAQLADGAPITAGAFMTGRFPIMLFALPSAALAMYHSVYDDQKEKVKAMYLTSAIICFGAGVTEPLEFSFLFAAPKLYIFHIFMSGLSFFIMTVMKVHIGHPFTGGVLDYVLYGVIPNRTSWWKVIVVGIVYAGIYYVVFKYYITKNNIEIAGRETKREFTEIAPLLNNRNERQKRASGIIDAVGGINNILYVDSCMSRLRLTLKDESKLNEQVLKILGFTDIMNLKKGNIQIIVGALAPIISDDIQTKLYQYQQKKGD